MANCASPSTSDLEATSKRAKDVVRKRSRGNSPFPTSPRRLEIHSLAP
jgi:hypothetical protein